MNVCAKFRCAPLHIKKVLGICRELITKEEEQLEWPFGTRLPGASKKKSALQEVIRRKLFGYAE